MARATLSTQTVNKPNQSPSAKCGDMQKPLPTYYIKVSAKSLAVFFYWCLAQANWKIQKSLGILLLSYLTPKIWRLDNYLDLMKNVLLLMGSVLNVLTSAIHGSSTSIWRIKGDEDLLYGVYVVIGNIGPLCNIK